MSEKSYKKSTVSKILLNDTMLFSFAILNLMSDSGYWFGSDPKFLILMTLDFLKSWRTRAEKRADILPFEKMMKPYHLSVAEWFCLGVVAYQNLIGKHGYSFEVWQNGSLIRKFIVHPDLNAVYRFERDGNSVMIYNIDGTKG